MHEDVVHAFDDAVPLHPKVLAIAVVPIPVDPNPPRTSGDRVLNLHGLWRRRRMLGGRDRLRLLNDDHGFAVDLFGLTFLGLDDHVGCGVRGLSRLPFLRVPVV
jgi:hypothetical protein